MRTGPAGQFAASAALAAALLCLTACSRPQALPVFGQVPHFVLTDSNGLQFDSHVLDGKVWVADFFFTSCTDLCPRMTSQMHWVSRQVEDVAGARFVSFTVDPEHDTPPVLADYAKRFRAEPERWFFLTGAQPVLQKLDFDTFKLGSVDGSLTHSTRFVLVDRRSRIRGYYSTDDDTGLKPLVPAIRRLAKE
ncbi:MAG: SCO family protein [Bryobacteraceae bacterium]